MAGFRLVAALALAALAGCRMDRMTIREPVSDRFVEVESGDRFWVELEENTTTGYAWEVEVSDERNLVETSVKHIPHETPAGEEALCGAPGKAEIMIRIHRGFVGPATVLFRYVRPWERERPVRQIKFVLWRRDGDVAPWRD